MTPDRRSYTERVTDAGAALTRAGRPGGKKLAAVVLAAAGVPDLLDERAALRDALDEARDQIDGQAWADLEADRDRYRDALRQLCGSTAVSLRNESPHHAEAHVYLPDLDAAHKALGAS